MAINQCGALQGEPFFTVVVPWHGNPDDLPRALASLRAQTWKDFETVVVCNGPGAAAMAEKSRDPTYAGCRFIAVAEADASRARNAGVDAARGRWVAFLDVDDVFLPDKLAVVAAETARSSADIFLSRGLRVRGPRLRALYPAELLGDDDNPGEYFYVRGANCSATSIVARREVARLVRFPDGFKRYDDNDFLIRAHAAGAFIHMIAEPLFEWSDERTEGRMSQSSDYDAQVRWAENLRPALSDKAFHAFMARRIAQYRLPHDLTTNAAALYRGWRHGGIALAEIAQFIVRAFLPGRLARWLIDLKAARDARRVSRRLGHDSDQLRVW